MYCSRTALVEAFRNVAAASFRRIAGEFVAVGVEAMFVFVWSATRRFKFSATSKIVRY